jgi:hypothetical protein
MIMPIKSLVSVIVVKGVPDMSTYAWTQRVTHLKVHHLLVRLKWYEDKREGFRKYVGSRKSFERSCMVLEVSGMAQECLEWPLIYMAGT